jgi:hypothetical protein
MAARENQGLQIALIIFVVLTIALAVSTFMFFSKFDEERNKIAEYEKKASEANKLANDYQSELKEVKTILGAAPADGLKAIQEAKEKDFKALGHGMGEDKQNYRALAMQLEKTLKEAQGNLIAAQEREKKLNDKIKVDETTKVKEVSTYKQSTEDRKTDYDEEREKLMKSVASADDAKQAALQKIEAQKKSFDKDKAALAVEIQDRDATIKKLSDVIEKQKRVLREGEAELEFADGTVRWVNQGEQLAWIDKGSADGLRQQVSFKVIDREEPNPATAPTKATIEVVRVTDSHSAEARIISDNPSDPIMPGDLLFSTAWQPGRIEHFAVAGFTDVDGDRISDRDLVKQLIQVNRGVLDAELTDKGDLVGELTPGTKYLILGDKPTDKDVKGDILKNWSRMMANAETLGIRVLPLSQFLDYVGYKAQQRTVALGRDADPSSFKPKMPDVPQKSIGKPIDYSPIRPKPKKTLY